MRSAVLRDHRIRSTQTLYPRVRLLLIVGCVGLGFVTLISIFFYSRMFTIEFVDVKAVGGIEQNAARALVFQQMARMSWGIFPQRNLLIFSARELEEELSRRFVVRTLSIRKRLPQTLLISLTGEPFRLLHLSDNRIYDRALDGSVAADITEHRADEGVSIGVARLIASGQHSAATEIPDVPIVKGGEHLDRETIQFIRSAFSLSRARGYQPMYFEIAAAAPTITLHTREGWTLLFSRFGDAAAQIAQAAAVLDEHFKDTRAALQYIDVRFDNRVYYK